VTDIDSALLARLLAPEHIVEQMARHADLSGARLLSATPQEIEAAGYLSDLVGVRLSWATADGELPASAVLKVAHPGFSREELQFYETIAPRIESRFVPRFHAGGVDEPSGRTWLLLEDLSESHEPPSVAPVPPTFERNAQLVEGLAQFHAAGWGKEGWNGTGPTLDERLRSSDWLQPGLETLFTLSGDALDDSGRDMYARWLRGFPSLVERARTLRGTTLVHGDAHAWNWMLPRPGRAEVPRLLDWDGWHIGVGVWDLAYMIVLFWDRDVRQRFEMPLLDRYHGALAAAGVSGYSREALHEDYRLAVLLHLRTPIARFVRGLSAYVWWPMLTRVRHAVADLRCLELLD
jgi:Ser/Thr protein kinase RdoA (MazF antagonist)